MRPIDKFILHVIHNWDSGLKEAYAPSIMTKLMDKFKDEADDLNINITDEQLKKYIERFDVLKNSSRVTEPDLFKYSLGKLIKIVTSVPGAEIEDEEQEDDTPDVVYHEGDIIIWNGAKQGNCVTYGANEKWCITRPGGSYWGNYRYGQGEPTFYLAKNNALSDSNKLSFVAIQVLNNGTYKFTNRNNSPGMEGPFSWSELNNIIPWLQEIPNARNILKYIPLSNTEKANNVYKNRALSIRQWAQLSFNDKKQYLIARQGNQLFLDINNVEFISKYLPEYPQIATAIAEVPDIIDMTDLLKNLDKFSNQDRKTITARIREKLRLDLLDTNIPFDVKKLLVALDKFDIPSNKRIYNSKDGKAIIELDLDNDDIRISLFTEEDDYPNIKLNSRTSKYLLDYPDLDKIPFKTLLDLISKNVINKNVLDQILAKAKTSSESTIVAKDTENGTIIIDGNSLIAYRLQDGNISELPFDDEEVQAVFNGEEDNQEFQQGIINRLFKNGKDIPNSIDRESLISLINSTSYPDRTFTTSYSADIPLVFLTTNDADPVIFTAFDSIQNVSGTRIPFIRSVFLSGRRINTVTRAMSELELDAYFSYLQNQNQVFNDQQLLDMMKTDTSSLSGRKKKYILDNPNLPLDQTNIYIPIENDGTNYLVNTQNPANSAKISNETGKLIKANIPVNSVRRLLGARAPQVEPEVPAADQPAAPQNRVAGRGRPQGVPNAPRQPQERQRGNVNVGEAFAERGLLTGFGNLPRNDQRRLNVTDAVALNRIGNNGASARDNRLAGQGRVTNVVGIGKSRIYFIRLNDDTRIASINIQPGNREYVVTNNRSYSLNSPRELLNFLQNNDILEALRKSMFKLYLQENPHMIGEMKKIKSLSEDTLPSDTVEPRRGRPADRPDLSRRFPIENVDVSKVFERFVDKGLDKGFADLPFWDFRRLNVDNAVALNKTFDKGAADRDNLLSGQGKVTNIIGVDQNKIYFIKLDNDTQIASINMRPGNREYVVTNNNAYSLSSLRELTTFLKNNNPPEPLSPKESRKTENSVDVPKAFINKGLGKGFADLPLEDFAKLNVAYGFASNDIRDIGTGAVARNKYLAGKGQVTDVLQVSYSRIYFIKLNNANQDIIASIKIQPGNRDYVVTSQKAFLLNSPNELTTFLKNNNLLEQMKNLKEEISQEAATIHAMLQTGQQSAQEFIDYNNVDVKKLIDYIKQYKGEPREIIIRDIITGNVKDYNPKSLKQFKDIFLKKIKNKNMRINEFKSLVREVVSKKLNARQTFAKDLQQDPDYNKAKEDAKKITPTLYSYDDSIIDKKEDYGVPNVLNTDYFIDKDKLKKIKQNMKTSEFKSLVREVVKKKLAENQPAPARETPGRETETIPDRGTEEEKKRRRIGNPNVDPKPKAMNETEQEMVKQIVARYKSKK
jgi:hypothetical protein